MHRAMKARGTLTDLERYTQMLETGGENIDNLQEAVAILRAKVLQLRDYTDALSRAVMEQQSAAMTNGPTTASEVMTVHASSPSDPDPPSELRRKAAENVIRLGSK